MTTRDQGDASPLPCDNTCAMAKRKKTSNASVPELARAMHASDRTLTSSAIARALSEQLRIHVTHQRVQQALRFRGAKPGRRPLPTSERIARLKAEIAALEAQQRRKSG